MPRPRLVEESVVLLDGPWTHRDVSANGIRLHVAEAGSGPLVVLLHGFPLFWWTWRHELEALSAAGYRAAAPQLVRRLVVLGHPHPLRWGPALVRDGEQRAASRYLARFQAPWHPERWLVEDQAANVPRLIAGWAGPHFPLAATADRWREAMLILGVPHCAVEYYRWFVRSVPRADGRLFRRALRHPVTAPTLHLHGALDRAVLPRTAQGSGERVTSAYEWRLLPDVGHFPHEEAPELVAGEIVRWCKE